ncbi:hypothetical protein RKD31_000835 [Streptomyces sp. SAI-163]
MQPGERALDHPADLAQSGAVGDAPSSDHGFDATFPPQAAVRVEVVAPVGVQAPGFAARASPSSPNSVIASGVPWRSKIRWCLEPGRARSTGEGLTWSPFEGPDVRSVHGAVVQVQQVSAAKLGQEGGVQAWPDAGLGPVPQPAPGRHAGTAHSLRNPSVRTRPPTPQPDYDSRRSAPAPATSATGLRRRVRAPGKTQLRASSAQRPTDCAAKGECARSPARAKGCLVGRIMAGQCPCCGFVAGGGLPGRGVGTHLRRPDHGSDQGWLGGPRSGVARLGRAVIVPPARVPRCGWGGWAGCWGGRVSGNARGRLPARRTGVPPPYAPPPVQAPRRAPGE